MVKAEKFIIQELSLNQNDEKIDIKGAVKFSLE